MEDCEALCRAFGALKPVCDGLVKKPTKENVQRLQNNLKSIPKPALQRFQSYVIFPIEGNLSVVEGLSDGVKTCLVDCLKELLTLTRITVLDSFIRLYRLLFLQITHYEISSNTYEKRADIQPVTKLAAVSEELKLSVVCCVKELFVAAFSDVLDKLYEFNYYPVIAWGILLCTKIVQQEKMISLRVESLQCILHHCLCHDEADLSDIVLRDKARNAVMRIMPGIISTASLACRNVLDNHHITQSAIRVWYRIIVLVMVDNEDDEFSKFQSEQQALLNVNTHQYTELSSNKTSHKSGGHQKKTLEEKKNGRTNEWLNKASTNLAEISSIMVQLQHHSHYSVRKELAIGIYEIMWHCSRNMKPSLSTLMESLIILSQDEMEEIERYSCMALKKFSSRYESDSEKSFFENIEESFYSFLTRFPRVVLSSGVTSQMNLLNGYLLLLGTRLPQVLSSKTHLNRLLFCLIHAVKIDVSGVPLLHEATLRGSDGSMAKHANFMKEILNFYLNLPVWPASSILNKTESSIHDDQIHAIQLCLAIDGIGKMASVVGKDVFTPWLLQCLYAVLEAAGSPLEVISCAGLDAVHSIANACADGDLTALICNNTDYLTHHITKRLRHYHRHPGLLAVLSVIMQYSSVQVLPSLHEIISEVLQQSYDRFQMNNMYAYIRTFLTFIASVRRWQVEDNRKLFKNSGEVLQKKTPFEQFLDYKKSKAIVENLSSDSDSDDERNLEEKFSQHYKSSRIKNNLDGSSEKNEEEIIENEKKDDIPICMQLVIDIVQRSLHFLPSKDPMLRILVLQVLDEGVLLLSMYPNQLLPVVHAVWSPLVNRFQLESNEPLVMNRAFKLLQTLASTSKDFIRFRVLREVLPPVCNVLKNKAAESILKDTKSAYRLTQQYKLQKCLLEGLGQLAVDIELTEYNINEIMDAATPYLNSLQPQPLQSACIELFRTVTTVSRDLVWLHLINIWSPTNLLKPLNSSSLPSCQVKTAADTQYKKNVQILLQCC
ncbi:telo2 interacting protein 1 isoform X2 [Lycorma delicatula]|uniref:telo2 interacting protein 1 isoform X2 n=1 Tax=Lycorma delicatula TaxID=130591 RepID=UPI003F5165EA